MLALLATFTSMGCSQPQQPASSQSAPQAGAPRPLPSSSGESTQAAPKPPLRRHATTKREPRKQPQKKHNLGPKPIRAAKAAQLLFESEGPSQLARCSAKEQAQVACLIAAAFAKDRRAKKLALELYQRSGSVAGLEPKRTMNGGWRGFIQLVPERPIGRHRRHLGYLVAAARDFETFFSSIKKNAPNPVRFYYRHLAYKFLRSVNRTTPSAYAKGWSVAYNVSGSLHRNAKAVRETMFHEIFHLNDRKHKDWSERALGQTFAAILKRCNRSGRLSTPCLQPYAPGTTMVRGGTYYAFQPGNGVWEYAAELATRYFNEHWTLLSGRRLRKRPFKCGPKENQKSWQLFAEEFFGGVDRIPDCG